MTNFEKITQSVESLNEFIEQQLNEDRDDWNPVGCFSCSNYGTHHANETSSHYTCGDCEFKDGVLNWLKQKIMEKEEYVFVEDDMGREYYIPKSEKWYFETQCENQRQEFKEYLCSSSGVGRPQNY